jgi:hypothetical protein
MVIMRRRLRIEKRIRKCQEDDLFEKTILSADFSRTDFVSIMFRPHGQKSNSHFGTKIILPNLIAGLSVCRPKLKATASHLHMGNARSHNCHLSFRQTEE